MLRFEHKQWQGSNKNSSSKNSSSNNNSSSLAAVPRQHSGTTSPAPSSSSSPSRASCRLSLFMLLAAHGGPATRSLWGTFVAPPHAAAVCTPPASQFISWLACLEFLRACAAPVQRLAKECHKCTACHCRHERAGPARRVRHRRPEIPSPWRIAPERSAYISVGNARSLCCN